ncbi:MAG: hypothetical protein WC526_02260 [Patescibacteria group bacterium]
MGQIPKEILDSFKKNKLSKKKITVQKPRTCLTGNRKNKTDAQPQKKDTKSGDDDGDSDSDEALTKTKPPQPPKVVADPHNNNTISEEGLKKFIALYENKYGQRLERQEAFDAFFNLINIVKIAYYGDQR